MQTLCKLIQLLDKPQRRLFALFTLLSLLSPAMYLFGVSRVIPLIQQLSDPDASGRVTGQIVFLAVVLLLVGVFDMLKSRCSAALAVDVAHGWSLKIYALYEEEDLAEHNEKTIEQAINNVRTDPLVCAGMLSAYVDVAVNLLTAAAYSGIMMYMSRTVGVVSCLLMAALMAGFYFAGHNYVIRFSREKRRLEIKAGGLVSTSFGAYKEIKVDSRKGKLLERYREASEECARIQKNYTYAQRLPGVLFQDFMQAALLFLLAAVLAVGTDLSRVLPGAVIYITLLTRLLPVGYRITSAVTSLQYASKYYEALRTAMERYDALRRKQAGRARLREKRVTLSRGIRVENLSFHYPNGKQILENASIEIPAGRSVAIVGPSGEGKTTLLDLILGLLRPQAGHIWYDDFDIVEERDGQGACRADLGNVVSYIPQIVYLNDNTIRSNVAFMVEENEERLVECLKYAQIWEDVQKMPDGLDTVIGRNGASISGGQRQRIALARALYKEFEILIMDEATASLDADTEAAVIDSIRKMKGDKTLLMVTHHFHLANECEFVYRLENRKLVRVK